jgi:hypothetical protein
MILASALRGRVIRQLKVMTWSANREGATRTVKLNIIATTSGLPSNGPWIIATASYLPGNVNLDGTVNGLDIADLASHSLQTGLNGGNPGDANFDGTVNGLDIAVISSRWLATSAGGSGAAVPEPSTIMLARVGALLLIVLRRRRGC